MTFLDLIKRFYVIPIIFSMAILTSCNNEKKEEIKDLNEPAPEMTLEQKKSQLQNVAPSQTNSGAVAGNINPPHGQPGHRCDIPVGAPLDGGTSKPQSVKLNNQPAQPAPNSAVQSGQKPAVNPPHGQPFHRCDIKVGDPLP